MRITFGDATDNTKLSKHMLGFFCLLGPGHPVFQAGQQSSKRPESPFILCKKEFYTFNFALIFHQFLGKAVKIWIGEGGDFFLYGTGIILSLGFI